MSLTRETARDNIIEFISDAINAASVNIIISYEDKGKSTPPTDASKTWAFVRVRHTQSIKQSFGSSDGSVMFEKVGSVLIDLWCPSGDGLLVADRFTDLIVDRVEDKTTLLGVNFRSVTDNEGGNFGPWTLTSIDVGFDYCVYR